MNAALFDLLPDFGNHAPTAPTAARNGAVPPSVSLEPAVPAPDLGALVAEAVAEAETALAERLAQAHRQEVATLEAAHLAEKTAFLEEFGDRAGQMVAVRMGEIEQQVASLASTAVARMLGGILSQDLQRRSLDALAGTLAGALRDGEALRITVRGPALLLETLKTSLGALSANLDFSEAEGFDLTVVIDDVVFETRMGEWSGALAEVLA